MVLQINILLVMGEVFRDILISRRRPFLHINCSEIFTIYSCLNFRLVLFFVLHFKFHIVC